MKLKKFSNEEVFSMKTDYELPVSSFEDYDYVRTTENDDGEIIISFRKPHHSSNYYFKIIDASADELVELTDLSLRKLHEYKMTLSRDDRADFYYSQQKPVYDVRHKALFIQRYGSDNVQYWLDNVEMESLWWCLDAFSNDSFVENHLKHRDKYLNKMEMVLQETPQYLYRTVTYGVCPNGLCTDEIGKWTGRTYGNCEIAEFLIVQKIKDLKAWLLENHEFTDSQKRLLHYFNGGD